MNSGPTSEQRRPSFKDLFEECLRQAQLNTRTLHRQFERQTGHFLPENTIASWRSPHSTTGQPNLPGEERLVLLATWLCARDGVEVTEQQLLEARREDKAAQTRRRRGGHGAGGRPTGSAAAPAAGAPGLADSGRPGHRRSPVTFLSARICGWRPLARSDDEWDRCHSLLREAVVPLGGTIERADRNAILAAFPATVDAVLAATEAQRMISTELTAEGDRLQVSIAVHAGPAALTPTGYAGLALHQAGRMSAACHGGQVVVSEAACQLLSPEMPDSFSLVDLGEVRLNDLSTPQRLYELRHPDLAVGFPAIRSVDRYPHNLPPQLTSFIGRVGELERLRSALISSRLCTLTGSGGSGKTRMALRLAAELIEDFADGVWLVDLASTSEAELVAQAVAAALGVREGGAGTYVAKGRRVQIPVALRLTDHLRDREVLLILDNCEHVVGSCATLVDGLLRTCPRLRILCTSREPLAVAGELVHRVPPLAVPPVGQHPGGEEIGECESVRLFLDRAAARRPDLRMDGPDIQAVREICRRVEGLALAIELAAARARMLSPTQILELVDDRLDLLSSGDRTTVGRHQTLRAMIDWSHDDLSPGEQVLFRRLSVFVGGLALVAAQHVCSGDGLERFEVLDLLGMLVDKSLVETEQHAGVTRYRLLETIRAYAGEKLACCGEAASFRARHQQWYLALAEEAEPALAGAEQSRWLDRVELDQDNLRAALDPSVDGRDAQVALRLAAALGHYWLLRGFMTEGRDHLENALAQAGPAPSVLRAKALAVAGYLALFDSDVDTAAERSASARELSTGLGYRRGEAWALRTLGAVAVAQERFGDGERLNGQALAASRELSDDWGTAFCLNNAANLEALHGNTVAGGTLYEEALAIRRAIGDTWGQTWTVFRLGILRTWQTRFDEADALFDEGLGLARGLRYGGGAVLNVLGRADAAHLRDDQVAACESYLDAYALARDLEDQTSLSLSAVGLANVALRSGELGKAADWLGLASAAYASNTASTLASLRRCQGHLARANGNDEQALDLHLQVLDIRQRLHDVRGTIEELEDIALLVARSHRAEPAASLLASTALARAGAGASVPPLYYDEVAEVRAALHLDEPGVPATAFAAVPTLSLGQAVGLARSLGARAPGR